MKGRTARLDSYFGARFGYVIHRDGQKQLVSIFSENHIPNKTYVFSYPYTAWDIGFEVPSKYVRELSFFGKIYVYYATKVARKFPSWVTI